MRFMDQNNNFDGNKRCDNPEYSNPQTMENNMIYGQQPLNNHQHNQYIQQNQNFNPVYNQNVTKQYPMYIHPNEIEIKHIKKTANGHALSILFMHGISIILGLILMILAFAVRYDRFRFLTITGDMYEYVEQIFYILPMSVFLIISIITTLASNMISATVFLKRRGFKSKDIFINSSTRNKDILKPRSIATLCMLALGINGFFMLINNLLLNNTTQQTSYEVERLIEATKFHSPLNIFLYFVYLAVIAPITEEFLFRGAFLQPLRRYGDKYAIIVSAIMFGLVHGNIFQSPFTFVLGLLLGYVTTKSNSIIPAIILHFVNNATAVLMNHCPVKYQFIIHICLAVMAVYALYKLFTYKKWVSFENEFITEQIFIPSNKYSAYFSSAGIVVTTVIYMLGIILTLFISLIVRK